MTENYNRLIKLLKELFQIDRPDLDFGIYRIMNQKRDEISAFMDNDLLPQVRKAFAVYDQAGTENIQAELDAAVKQAENLGIYPEQSPTVLALRQKLGSSTDVTALENEVYSHLYNFFSRYYQDGDFLSLRRYKKDVYAIPYEGEEVKLHWANADQYYIKSSENFRDYTFKIGNPPAPGSEDKRKTVQFKLVEADTELANNKAQSGNERRFVLCAEDPMIEEDGQLIIRFEYQPVKEKQDALNKKAVQRLLDIMNSDPVYKNWLRWLARYEPTEKNRERTTLEKHLFSYTAKNTFDYFIHKDLGGFLRRELDFYIKNEVMHLDDIEEETAPRVEQYLSQIKVIRRIAHKIIQFLEQIENFQKKLWLKKKFVVETNYCVTLDRIPEDMYPEIAANQDQHDEWVHLFAIDEIKADLVNPGYSKPLTVEFLKANDKLVLDTRFFDQSFKSRLLASLDDFDEQCDGLLVHSENFQALNLLQERYREQVSCTYIDPPYNTGGDGFAYKDSYQHSSWLSMFANRMECFLPLISGHGVFFASINDNEVYNMKSVLDSFFSFEQFESQLIIQSNKRGQTYQSIAKTHEYLFCYLASSKAEVFELPKEVAPNSMKDDVGHFELWELRNRNPRFGKHNRPNLYYPIYVNLKNLYEDGYAKISLNKSEQFSFEVFPKNSEGEDSCWRWGKDKVSEALSYNDLSVLIAKKKRDGGWNIYEKARKSSTKAKTIWTEKEVINEQGTVEVGSLGFKEFGFPKPTGLLRKVLQIGSKKEDLILDYFAGSGTTGHAVIDLNRNAKDHGKRKYILVEMGDYFDTVLKPRIQKVVYSKDWKSGKPTARDTGISHCFKYIRLESYEDTLNNLSIKLTKAQARLLGQFPSLREEYMLSYMMDEESRKSPSLLNLDQFVDPWSYTLKIATGSAGETRARTVDLVETFNYLIGLCVVRREMIRGVEVIEGRKLTGEKVLVIWRNTKETSNEDLDTFFRKQDFNPRDTEFDLIYVNGDNNLENLRRSDETWKVRLIEDDFKRLMFDVEDV
ncbi:site-specific DNA-methyltransferase [Desulfonatronovibrio magnus]|uniref:site-specific DNA-methyltransferase n=1 Tax=Desulfonatronovibrio magnus TaxID=698827 RepID=UPI0005EB8216|nr:site-specific DNA-methyltransferase [Desulfonatronovibrio magnus]